MENIILKQKLLKKVQLQVISKKDNHEFRNAIDGRFENSDEG